MMDQTANPRDQVLVFLGQYVQTNQVPYQELPNLISNLVETFEVAAAKASGGSEKAHAETPVQGAVSVSSEKSDASDIRPENNIRVPQAVAKTAPVVTAAEDTGPKKRGRKPKVYAPSDYVENMKATAKAVLAVEESVHNDGIICLIDGKKKTLLRPYLNTKYGLTPEDYRYIFNLDADYPMTAPDYVAKRQVMAKENGLWESRRKAEA